MSDALTPGEIARELGVSVRTVQRWIRSGRLPAQQVGGRFRVSPSSLAAIRSPRATATAVPGSRIGTIGTLLVANRGEIVERVGRTARGLGMRVIGIRAPDDRAPMGVNATVDVPSYLEGNAIIAAARRAGADAIHPGYGFLAENAAFAAAVTEAGLIWVGPPAAAIEAMGDKSNARIRARNAGVPILRGQDSRDQDEATLVAAAARIGFPLLVKPSAGGGGKGMRVVRNEADLPDALAAARREAAAAFGDDRLILERFVEHVRHVEIQVLFDSHGNAVHLGERDCSAQRRNQKVVEEAPGPSVTPELRERMGRAALAAAGAVGYVNAGTVEFLLADDGSFAFLEMNTRLQVEHPVTEAVTGRDLVADQLRIAAGEPLGFEQTDVALRGNAIEVRLYAEDPEAGFLPSTGRIVHLRWPDAAHIRVDAGVEAGDEVSDRYDPMLAKLIATGADRREALARLRAALDATEVLGLTTNLRYLRWLLGQPTMADGEMRTDDLGRLGVPDVPRPDDDAWRSAAIALRSVLPDGVWGGGWRLNAAPAIRITTDDETRTISLPEGGSTAAGPFAADDDDVAHVDVEGRSTACRIAPPPTVESALRQAAADTSDHANLVAPMPGRVIALRAAEGTSVRAGAALVVIEAMKMEHAVVSPIDGLVTRLAVGDGDQVQRGDLLAEVSATDPVP